MRKLNTEDERKNELTRKEKYEGSQGPAGDDGMEGTFKKNNHPQIHFHRHGSFPEFHV